MRHKLSKFNAQYNYWIYYNWRVFTAKETHIYGPKLTDH